jgi:hypothetical protein
LAVHGWSTTPIAFAVDSDSAGSSIITVAPRDETREIDSTARLTDGTIRAFGALFVAAGSPSASAPPPLSAPRRLNVAIVCHGTGDVVGGSFISTLRFGERLKARGHRVVFISRELQRRSKTPELARVGVL